MRSDRWIYYIVAILLVIVLLVAYIPPLRLFLYYFFDYPMVQGFVGNLLATIIGVLVGIPVAFWINRGVEEREKTLRIDSERKQKETQDRIEREKTEKILVLLRKELSNNKQILSDWKAGLEANPYTFTPQPKVAVTMMGNEIWNAFSDGGELQWIEDPLLLSSLADAYGQISRLRSFAFNPNYSVPVVKSIREGVVEAYKLVDGALRSIESSGKIQEPKG